MYKNSQKHRRVGKVQREDLLSWQKDDSMFVGKGGVEALQWQ